MGSWWTNEWINWMNWMNEWMNEWMNWIELNWFTFLFPGDGRGVLFEPSASSVSRESTEWAERAQSGGDHTPPSPLSSVLWRTSGTPSETRSQTWRVNQPVNWRLSLKRFRARFSRTSTWFTGEWGNWSLSRLMWGIQACCLTRHRWVILHVA